MAVTIGSNIASLATQRRLNEATSQLGVSLERLSSGLRINRASDDAAGLSIASQLGSKARVFTQGIRNLNDAVSASSIAEGALDSLKTISERQLELAEQAANGTYSLKQRQALNAEANSLVNEFNRIVSSVTFNGLDLFDPSLGSVIIQAGYGDSGSLQLGISDRLQRAVGDGTFSAVISLGLEGGSGPNDGFTGDLNGDGNTDMVVADYYSSTVSILLGNGDGTFAAAKTLAAGTSACPPPISTATGSSTWRGRKPLPAKR